MKKEYSEIFSKIILNNICDAIAYCEVVFGKNKKIEDALFLAVNRHFSKLTRWKNPLNKKLTKLIPGVKKTNPNLFKIAETVMKTGKSKSIEISDSKMKQWFLVSLHKHGENHMVIIAHNISDIKKNESKAKTAREAALNVLQDLDVTRTALEREKAKHEAIFQSIGDGLLFIDSQTKICLTNEMTGKLLGRKQSELLGTRFHSPLVMEGEGRVLVPAQRDPMLLALRGHTTTGAMYFCMRKDGTRFPALVNAAPVFLNKKIIGAVGVLHDITERKRIEEALKESESKYRRIINTTGEGIVILDANFETTFANARFAELLGYSLEEMKGKPFIDFIFPEDVAAHNEKVSNRRAGKSDIYERHLKKKNGTGVWAIVSATPIRDASGKFIGSFGMFTDITDRKKAEEQLQERTNKLNETIAKDEALLSSIGDGVIATNTKEKGIIIFINKAAEKMLGFKAQEVIGKSLLKIIQAEDEHGNLIPEEARPISKIFTEKSTVENKEYFYIRKNGTKFPAAITVTPVLLEGNIVGSIEIFRDITKEKELDRAKSEFLSLASHQLRTPLSGIKWTLELFGQDESLNEKQKERINDLYASNQRLIDLVNSLLNVARIETGRVKPEKKSCNIGELIATSYKVCKTNAEIKKQIISVKIGKKIEIVQTDPILFGEALENFLSNSITYAPENSRIEIKVEDKEQEYKISISNIGSKISEEDQKHLFDKFYRGVDSQRIKSAGSGLGLFIAKGAIEAMGGKVGFESNAEKTTFFFTITK